LLIREVEVQNTVQVNLLLKRNLKKHLSQSLGVDQDLTLAIDDIHLHVLIVPGLPRVHILVHVHVLVLCIIVTVVVIITTVTVERTINHVSRIKIIIIVVFKTVAFNIVEDMCIVKIIITITIIGIIEVKEVVEDNVSSITDLGNMIETDTTRGAVIQVHQIVVVEVVVRAAVDLEIRQKIIENVILEVVKINNILLITSQKPHLNQLLKLLNGNLITMTIMAIGIHKIMTRDPLNKNVMNIYII
jgi:hypothetical protein